MFVEEVIPAIVEKYESFTKVEQVIADYLIANKSNDDLSIKAMKERLFVSEASLSRFAKKLGFPGYREFVYQYQQIFRRGDHISVSSSTVIKYYDDILGNITKKVDESQIERIAKAMSEAKHIFVVGIGSSGLAAEEMKRRLTRLGLSIESSDQSDIMKMRAICQSEEDLVIGISLSGTKEEVLFALRQSRQRGARTVFITGNRKKHEFVDEHVLIPVPKGLDSGILISPQFPILVITDLLYHFYLNLFQAKALVHQETVKALSGRWTSGGAAGEQTTREADHTGKGGTPGGRRTS
ncbi:MAG: MurR/RpiR family transcriptional regulator [Lachnospiraceae bacterium]|nr:MurR/RpiR family transcriptional regulator [Lachnospiraceae bacterium]